MSWKSEIEEIKRRRRLAAEQGGNDAVERQHSKGKLTIRERISELLDPGSFEEVGGIAGAAEESAEKGQVVFSPANFLLGFGKISGRRCIVGGEDFTLRGGSPNEAGLRKSVYAEELACLYRVPLVRLHEGAGGSVGGTGPKASPPPVFAPHRFCNVAQALASVPVVTAALGAVAGMPAARLVASHFSVMARATAQVLIAGPAIVQRALGERKTKEELGDADVHTKNGVIDNAADSENDALAQIRQFLSYLPANIWELAPLISCDDAIDRRDEELVEIIPRDRRIQYNMRQLLSHILDRDSMFEFGKGYGHGQIVGFARLSGQSIGVWANDCRYMAGAMTALGAQKVRRFLELCQTFHLPIVCFVDEPGFMIGSAAEQAGTIRHGTSTVLTAAMTTVPWASVVVRRSFGVAQAAHYGPNAYVLAWPSAEMGALPVEGGVAVAYHREIASAADPDARRRELEEQLAARQSPFPRAETFSVHDMIDPRETRLRLCRWIDWAQPLLEKLVGPSSFGTRP